MAAIVVDVTALAADTATIDALARVKLWAQRRGYELQLRNASDDLRQLAVFVGLGEVLRLEPRRQPEEWEQPIGIEEERELGDSVG